MKEADALARLAGAGQISYDDADDILQAFGFVSEFEVPSTTWYWHPKYQCGRFPANPRYEFSVLSEVQRGIIVRMVRCVIDKRDLEQHAQRGP